MSASTVLEDRLFVVCSSICCCQTPSIDPASCAETLIEKVDSKSSVTIQPFSSDFTQYDCRERVLVQLSAIRCLYSCFSRSLVKSDLDKCVCISVCVCVCVCALTISPISQVEGHGTDFKAFSVKVVDSLSRRSQIFYQLIVSRFHTQHHFHISVISHSLITDFSYIQGQCFFFWCVEWPFGEL